eukprot:595571-Prymnesium_polylepis.1
MGSLGPLPPIDAPPTPTPTAPKRSAEEQAALEAELNEMHELLGVKRGEALKEAMKPELVVPNMPTPAFSVAAPALSDEAAMLELAAAASQEKKR